MDTHKKIERGCEVNYAGNHTASAGKFRDDVGSIRYGISYQQDEMPAFSRKEFDTEAELIAEMKQVAPLSHWRTVKYDE